MTYTYSYRPDTTVPLRNGKTRIFYDIQETTEEESIFNEAGEIVEVRPVVVYLCKAVDIAGILNESKYGTLVSAIIRDKYSVDDELALGRHARNGSHAEEVAEHDAFAEFAKSFSRQVLGMD